MLSDSVVQSISRRMARVWVFPLLLVLLGVAGVPTLTQAGTLAAPLAAQPSNLESPPPKHAPGTTPRADTPLTTTVTIPSTAQWINTGVTLNSGDHVVITGIGAWSPGSPQTGWVGADGNVFPWPDNFLNLTDIGSCSTCAQTNVPHWAALIGYIGTNPPPPGSYTSHNIYNDALKVFLVGSSLVTNTLQTGPLWLNFNDDAYSDAVSDNRGQLTAEISVNATGSPLLDLPWAYDPQDAQEVWWLGTHDSDERCPPAQCPHHPNAQGYVWSWFDHNGPTQTTNSSVTIHTGITATVWVHDGCYNSGPSEHNSWCYDGHEGIDFSGLPGGAFTPILAAAGGVVAYVQTGVPQPAQCHRGSGGFGNYVVLYHPQAGIFTLYGHLSSIGVTLNQTVGVHQQLGIEGCTGNADGNHLHFGVYKALSGGSDWQHGTHAVIDPFGWQGDRLNPPATDPWAVHAGGAPSSYLWARRLGTAGRYDPNQSFTLHEESSASTVLVPAGALPGPVTLELASDAVPGPADPWRSTGHAAVLSVLPSGLTGGAVPASFSQPVSITIAYTDSDLRLLDAAQLTVFRWDGASSSWLPLATHVVPAQHLVWTQTTEAGPFALFAPLTCTSDLFEPDDNDNNVFAPLLLPGQGPLLRNLDRSDDQDWVRVEVTHSVSYTFRTTGLAPGVQTLLRLYDSDATTLLASAESSGGFGATITWTAPADGTVFVQVTNGYGGTPGCSATYNLVISGACAVSFSDVHQTDYFYGPVLYLACQGAISGYADGSFRPYNQTTRGQLAKIVVSALGWSSDTTGGPHFTDVPPSNPFYAFIETAYHRGIISGYADGTFKWGSNVTRGQLSKVIVSAAGWPINTSGGPHFSDVPASNPFYPFVETAFHVGIISGYGDGTFRWQNPATRGQIAKIVDNAGRVQGPPLPTETPTPTATVPPTATATPCAGVVLNGGFETGDLTSWIISGTNPSPIVLNAQPRSGMYSALLGTISGAEPLGNSSIYQQITVPAGGSTLSFWWNGGTTDTITYDWQDAYITDPAGAILAPILHTCQTTGGWINQTFDLTPFAGQTIRLVFEVHQDGYGDDTYMYMDDVTLLLACNASGPARGPTTATSTPTAVPPSSRPASQFCSLREAPILDDLGCLVCCSLQVGGRSPHSGAVTGAGQHESVVDTRGYTLPGFIVKPGSRVDSPNRPLLPAIADQDQRLCGTVDSADAPPTAG